MDTKVTTSSSLPCVAARCRGSCGKTELRVSISIKHTQLRPTPDNTSGQHRGGASSSLRQRSAPPGAELRVILV
ncbi:hypothetical protein E2C01_039363 [Portunus trituberculatus]|uniref:Uncharacterized protein n=1 Tax=Portunus trituberculatus TaxID=210409 RepID=A0A5B7FJH3_PORTR|nr:hypothetical protein [Portunus trituberculatus]